MWPLSAVTDVRTADSSAESPVSGRRLKPATVLKLVVAVALMAIVLYKAGIDNLVQTLRDADWRWVVLALGFATLAVIINVSRWQLMLRGQGSNVALASLIRLYLIGMF